MNRKRLEHLKTVLSRVKEEQFNIARWGLAGQSCGTVCCAFGWAGMDPEFQAQGLRPVWTPLFPEDDGLQELRIYFTAGGTVRGGLKAAEAFFGLSWEQAQYIFILPLSGVIGRRTTLADVIARTDYVLAGGPGHGPDWPPARAESESESES